MKVSFKMRDVVADFNCPLCHAGCNLEKPLKPFIHDTFASFSLCNTLHDLYVGIHCVIPKVAQRNIFC